MTWSIARDIYCVTNVLTIVGLTLYFQEWDLRVFLLLTVCSFGFSLTALLLLLGLLHALAITRTSPVLCWSILLLALPFISFFPFLLFGISLFSEMHLFAMCAAYIGLLPFCDRIQLFSKTITMKPIKRLLLLFMVCLFLSGLTAIPIEPQLQLLQKLLPAEGSFAYWINTVLTGYQDMQAKYPFLLYGYDWLAFAHFVLTILFIGPYRDPVKNIWVIQFGMLACVLVLPFAFVAGHFRGIPIGWRLIDCAFGVFGFALLWVIQQKIKSLQKQ